MPVIAASCQGFGAPPAKARLYYLARCRERGIVTAAAKEFGHLIGLFGLLMLFTSARDGESRERQGVFKASPDAAFDELQSWHTEMVKGELPAFKRERNATRFA